MRGWEKIAMKKKNNTDIRTSALDQIYYFFL